MSSIQKFWTFEQALEKVKRDTDLDEDDEDESFITFEEWIGYFNEGIDEAESEVHKIDEDYFLTKAFLHMVAGQSDYDMPENIYADKLRSVMFDYNSERYEAKRLKRKDLFINIHDGNDPANTGQYRHYIRNDRAGERKLVLVPASRETATVPPLPSPVTPITLWYLRNANRIPLPGEYCNPEDILATSMNDETGIITVDPEFPYVTGDAVKFSRKQSTYVVPEGLELDTTYYVVRISDTKIKLATSLTNARAAAAGLVAGDRIQENNDPEDDENGNITGASDGSNRVFVLSATPYSDGVVQIYLNGVFRRQGTDYTIDGATITFAIAPAGESSLGAGDQQVVEAVYYPESDEPTVNPTERQEVPTGDVDGVNTDFTLSQTPASDLSVSVFVDGVIRTLGTHYEIEGKVISFYVAPTVGQEIDVVYDTAVVFFGDDGTGFLTMKVAATREIINATVIDIPEFSSFIMEWVKANCLFKEGDPRLPGTVAKLEQQRKQMVDALTEREPDDNNEMSPDFSFYEDMN